MQTIEMPSLFSKVSSKYTQLSGPVSTKQSRFSGNEKPNLSLWRAFLSSFVSIG